MSSEPHTSDLDALIEAWRQHVDKIDTERVLSTRTPPSRTTRLLSEDLSGRRWWWYRIPRSGPIIDELRQYFG